ncbi:hypothetical protein ACU61A_40935 [Pseudonocardia sichuanensis]
MARSGPVVELIWGTRTVADGHLDEQEFRPPRAAPAWSLDRIETFAYGARLALDHESNPRHARSSGSPPG